MHENSKRSKQKQDAIGSTEVSALPCFAFSLARTGMLGACDRTVLSEVRLGGERRCEILSSQVAAVESR